MCAKIVSYRDKKKDTDLKFVKSYIPQIEGKEIRILLHGPAGAGKSSFINSVQSILFGRMYNQALAANVSGNCFTKKVLTTWILIKEWVVIFMPVWFAVCTRFIPSLLERFTSKSSNSALSQLSQLSQFVGLLSSDYKPLYFSIVLQYTTYMIQKEDPTTFYPFLFNDIMGLGPSNGVHVDDVKVALRGHVKDGYMV